MINLDEFVAKFKEQYFDADEIVMDAQTEFRKFSSWDSLTGMSVLVMIKDEFGIGFPEDKFRACKTVEEVYNTLQQMK